MKNSTIHVLVVDDDQTCARYIQDVLVSTGDYTAETVNTLSEARAIIEGRPKEFDVICIDIVLSDGSGLDLARYCENIGLPVVLMTGNPDLALEEGADYRYPLVCKQLGNQPTILGVLKEVLAPPVSKDVEYGFARAIRQAGEVGDVRHVLTCYSDEEVIRLTGVSPEGHVMNPVKYNGSHTPQEIRNLDLPTPPDAHPVGKLFSGKDATTFGIPVNDRGCEIRCAFCENGLSFNPGEHRYLTRRNIVGEIIMALKHSRRMFFGKDAPQKYLLVNFNGMGESGRNRCIEPGSGRITWPVLDAITSLSKIRRPGTEDSLIRWIITTVGIEDFLAEVLKRIISSELPLEIAFHWSLNSLFANVRKRLMPGTANQDIKKLRRFFEVLAEITKVQITVSWIVIPGINNSRQDIAEIVSEFGGESSRWFTVKLMPYVGKRFCIGMSDEERMDDVKEMAKELDSEGVSYRVRDISGKNYAMPCGGTQISDVARNALFRERISRSPFSESTHAVLASLLR